VVAQRQRRWIVLSLCGLIGLLFTVGCSALPLPATTSSALAGCPVTLPVPEAQIPEAAARPINGGFGRPPGTTIHLSMYGNDALWVTIPPDGIMRVPARDDRLGQKVGWVRLIDGGLTIGGRRLDGPAPPVEAHVPSGYGSRGFQATGVFFPNDGCWEITGHLANRELRFVLAVQRAEP
jgi:hypothetical protein